MRRILLGLLGLTALLALYLLVWPTPVEPVAWTAPKNPGYTGPFERNERLGPLKELAIGNAVGPEDLALDRLGRLYAATHDGDILRIEPESGNVETIANTGGRPLGIELDREGHVIVADAYRGLLSVDPDGEVVVLTDTVGDSKILYADDLDVARNGVIYFSDASTKFGAEAFGGTLPASLLDINEHGGHGRLLSYDPRTKETRVLLDGLQFANGVALTHDETGVLVNESSNYRVLVYWLEGAKAGRHEVFIDELPGFPDNVSRGMDGRYWVALVSPRSAQLDAMADSPFKRKVMQRLPAFMRPRAQPYAHVIALGRSGRVLFNLQNPDARGDLYTSVTETWGRLYLGSLTSPVLRYVDKEGTGVPVELRPRHDGAGTQPVQPAQPLQVERLR